MAGQRRSQQRALDEGGCRFQTGVKKDGAEDCFVSVGQQPFFIATAGFLFARSQAQMIAELQLLCRGINRRSAHQPRQTLGKLSGIPFRKGAAKLFAGNQTENAIAQKFQALVIRIVGILAMRSVDQRAFELLARH